MQAGADAWAAKEPTVLYEDDDVLALNKPSGLAVHADGRNKAPTLSDWVGERYPGLADVGEPMRAPDGTLITRPGIVHRLDRQTSGVIILAKNQRAFEYLKKEFQERRVEKKYLAFVHGLIKEEGGVIDRPIGTSRKDFRLRSAQRGAKGALREAVTEYAVLKRGEGVTYVEARPKTGRTHQIRVHFKAINHPVVGDALYAPKHTPLLGFTRLALHARSLSFTAATGKIILVEAPLPADFADAAAQIGL